VEGERGGEEGEGVRYDEFSAAEAEAATSSVALLSLLLRRNSLQLLIELALGIGSFSETTGSLSKTTGSFSETTGIGSFSETTDRTLLTQMRLAQATLLAITQQLAERPPPTDAWRASFAALLPLVQARLPQPLTAMPTGVIYRTRHTYLPTYLSIYLYLYICLSYIYISPASLLCSR